MALVNPSRATGDVFGPVGKSFSFGFVTDTHHDPIKAMDNAKYYQDAAEKTADIVTIFNSLDLAFVYQNGDWIDGSASEAAALTDLADITAIFAACNKPQYHCLGNHEVTRLTKAQILPVTGQTDKWYSFVSNEVTFIVLDGNFKSDDDNDDLELSHGTGATPYVSYIPPTQRAWLEATLAASPYPCVILCHYPIYYVEAFSWGLTNAAAVRTILENSGKVIACVTGHLHDNYIKSVNGILYATLHASATNPYPALNYSVVTVYPDEMTIKITATGAEMSYIAA